jgi:hypothetical protein
MSTASAAFKGVLAYFSRSRRAWCLPSELNEFVSAQIEPMACMLESNRRTIVD